MNTCLKLHLPEWTLFEITSAWMNICPKLHLPEWTSVPNYISPKAYLPKITLARMYIWQKLHFPKNLFARIYTCQNVHLPKITFSRKLIFQILSFYSPSCLGQETAKGPFGLRVKLPPAHLSTTHGEISLLIEFTLQKYIIMLVHFQKLLSCA